MTRRSPRRLAALLSLCSIAAAPPALPAPPAPPGLAATRPTTLPADFQFVAAHSLGLATVDLIRQRLYQSERGLYLQEIRPGSENFRPVAADCWSAGVQLTALTAAGRIDPDRYVTFVRQYVDALHDQYWSDAHGIGGYDDGPHPKPPDRYYDDNAWIALGLVEAYEVTHNPRDLDQAAATLKFVLSGEDPQLGGGLFWRERRKESKNTCTNAPAISAAVRTYTYTHDKSQLDAAIRLYKWTVAHLRDERDGLYFDNVRLDGTVADHKWTYNTALMIRSGCLLYDATGDAAYLRDAQRSAAAAVAAWVDPATGAMADPARFAHLLAESLLELTARDHDPKWAAVDRRAVAYVWSHERDAAGFFPERWNRPQARRISDVLLINQASAARAFLRAAWPDVPPTPVK